MVGTIKVVNVNYFDERKVDGEVINIMRPSILGNPFKMSSEDEREISVRKYYHYLREEFKKKEEVYQELIKIVEKLKSGKDVYLACYCAPMLCHGDVIANAVMGIIEHEQRNR